MNRPSGRPSLRWTRSKPSTSRRQRRLGTPAPGRSGTRCGTLPTLPPRPSSQACRHRQDLARHPAEELSRNIPLTTAALKQGASFLLDATLEDDSLDLHFDGLKKVDGPSKLGEFHYIPMLFHEGNKVRIQERLLLELYGLLLARLQGQMPVKGIIWHGTETKGTMVRLNADLRKSERLL